MAAVRVFLILSPSAGLKCNHVKTVIINMCLKVLSVVKFYLGLSSFIVFFFTELKQSQSDRIKFFVGVNILLILDDLKVAIAV